jgi:hypothetical protein
VSQPSADAKAVVRAAEALTTQVRRIADAMETPVVRYEVAADDATTPATTCSAQYHGPDNPRTECIRVAHHEHRFHSDEFGWNWGDDVAVYPAKSDVTVSVHAEQGIEARAGLDALFGVATRQMTDETPETCNEPGPWGDAHACIRPAGHPDDHQGHDGCGWRTGLCGSGQHKPHPGFTCAEVDQTRPFWEGRWGESADEEAQRTARRDSLRNRLDRLDRSTVHHYDEAQLLRQHVEAEIREADTARAVAAGNKRHVQVMYGELTAAQAAIERVREVCDKPGRYGSLEFLQRVSVLAALDGTEQPTT